MKTESEVREKYGETFAERSAVGVRKQLLRETGMADDTFEIQLESKKIHQLTGEMAALAWVLEGRTGGRE